MLTLNPIHTFNKIHLFLILAKGMPANTNTTPNHCNQVKGSAKTKEAATITRGRCIKLNIDILVEPTNFIAHKKATLAAAAAKPIHRPVGMLSLGMGSWKGQMKMMAIKAFIQKIHVEIKGGSKLLVRDYMRTL